MSSPTRAFGGGEPDIVRDVRARIAEGPVPVLELGSMMIETCTERPLDRLRPSDNEHTSLADLVDSFAGSDFAPMHVLARTMVPLIADRALAQRIQTRLLLTATGAPQPTWLATVDRPVIDGLTSMIDPLGDGDNFIIGVRWPGGQAATLVVYVDHNLSTRVKDAFTVPVPFDDALRQYEHVSGMDSTMFESIDPADLRARIADALERGDRTIPPIVTETWPYLRPLVEWVISLLPDGGRAYEHRAWSSEELHDVADNFLSSRFATPLRASREQLLALIDPMLWLAASKTPGDPLRWSAVLVEIALVDWLPRKVYAPQDERRHVPEVLAALVRYAHQERGIAPELTAETLESVERWTPVFLEGIEGPPPSPARNAARLARIAAGLDPDEFDDDEFDDDEDWDDWLDEDVPLDRDTEYAQSLDRWEARVLHESGGADADAIDVEPVSDEPFDWSGVPGALRDRVGDLLDRIDRACDEMLDVEMRTICRRYLAALVRADPATVERSRSPGLLATALVWVAICAQLDHYSRSETRVPTRKELAAAMGAKLSSLGERVAHVDSVLTHRTTVFSDGPWHSAHRRGWVRQLNIIAEAREFLEQRQPAR
jgi:hypothetical protein